VPLALPLETEARQLTGRILLVDDNDNNQDILSRQLTRQGHAVAIAANGLQALEMLATASYDLILLDLLMPGLNGDEVLATLKQDPALRPIPVIMISALSEMDMVIHCISQGAEDYLTKPFNSTLLQARIHACLEKKRLREYEVAYLAQRLIAESTPVPIVMFSQADGRIVYANAAALDGLCLPPTPSQYPTLAALCPDQDSYPALLATLEREGQIQDWELRLQRLDQHRFWASVSLRPLTLHQQSLVLAAFWDITERKQAEVILRQNAAQLQQQLTALQVEINEAKLQEEVSEVTDTEFFQEVKQKAAIARQRHHQRRQRQDV
jgi:CheY-like chemotaxis protein